MNWEEHQTTALVADPVRRREEEKGEAGTFLEIGVRQVLPGEKLIGAGVGAGLGNGNTGFRAMVGIRKAFCTRRHPSHDRWRAAAPSRLP